jgi:predicted enzyme related to lactoylglutathione lyase
MKRVTAKRVTGLGGIFFKSRDAKRLHRWYSRHLGIPVTEWGGYPFEWREKDDPKSVGMTVWTIMGGATRYFAPSRAPFMVNYRVANLARVLAALKREKVKIDAKQEDSEFGRFAWIYDPDGNKIELWQPPATKAKRPKSRKKPAAKAKRRSRAA